MSKTMEELLRVEGLETRFHTEDGTIYAVNGVGYSLKSGETLGIVGESGSGKSVSCMSLLRLIPSPPGKIEKGSVLFEGEDLLTVSEHRIREIRGDDVAVIFQDALTAFNPVLTIGDQISEGMIVHGKYSEKEAWQRGIELLRLVGIPSPESRMDSYPHHFSGGMLQRAMIAMGLSCEPKLLIADEPTTALDVTIQAQIVDLVKRLQEEMGMSMIWISHDLGVVAGLADRVAVMYAGFIVEEAEAEELYDNPLHPYTIGLLESLPGVDMGTRKSKLSSIPGIPPFLNKYPVGCPFMPRCPFAEEHCAEENPPLMERSPGHKVACWVDVSTVREQQKSATAEGAGSDEQ